MNTFPHLPPPEPRFPRLQFSLSRFFMVVTLAALVAAALRQQGNGWGTFSLEAWAGGPMLVVVTSAIAGPSWIEFKQRAWMIPVFALVLLLLATVAVLNLDNGVGVLAGLTGLLLLLVGSASVTGELPKEWAAGSFILCLIWWLSVGAGISSRLHDVRSAIIRCVANAPAGKPIPAGAVDADLVLLWMALLGLAVVLGALLGWGLAIASD